MIAASRVCAAIVLAWLWVACAAAHQTSLSYLSVSKEGDEVHVALALAFRDLEPAVGVDADFDGAVTWGEAKARLADIGGYIAGRVSIDVGGACPLNPEGAAPDYRDGEGFLSLAFEAKCPEADRALKVSDTLFFDIDPTHRVLVHATLDGLETSAVLTADQSSLTLQAGDGGFISTFFRFIAEGADHLLAGPDHLLFLFVLILPALFQGKRGTRAVLLSVAVAVTGFTLGHALSLSAAVTGYLRPPQREVEIAIALSVLLTAIDNIRPFIPASRSSVAFSFGLIHGFGFASALGAMDLSGWVLATALIGFNAGIELAQILLVLAVFPVLHAIRGPAERLGLLPLGGSVAVAIISLWWIARRIAA